MDQTWDATTITEGSRALDLFVDRVQLCRQFLGHLNDAPARLSVTILHGDGGNGKSLLLDHLRLRLCRRFHADNWAYLGSLPDEECVAQAAVAADAALVPWMRFDFELGPRDPFGALLKLRRELTGTGLQFPSFDFAVVTYLHKSHQLTPERVRELFPDEELGLVLEVAQLVKEIPGAGVVAAFFNVANKRHGAWFERYRLRRNLDGTAVEEILRMDHETELQKRLPWFFAKDVNAGLGEIGGPEHLAFFLDNHGALFGHERDLPHDEVFQRDEWLRRLIRNLDPLSGVTIVLTGREPPRWDQAPRLPVPDLIVHHVGDLAETDALAYLELAGVTEYALRQRLCDDAHVTGDQIHPLSLGLGADLALVAAREGRELSATDLALDPEAGDRRKMVVNRLLRYVDAGMRDAVCAAAVTRSFDFAVYDYLGQALGYPTSASGFDTLVGFSFVRAVGNGRYRIHELIRRFVAEANDVTAHTVHEALVEFYFVRAATGSEEQVAEAIYHLSCLDWRRGFAAWFSVFEHAFHSSRWSVCAALLEVRSALPVEMPGAVGLLLTSEGQFLQRVSSLAEARTTYLSAIRAFDQALDDDPGEPEYLSNKGNALVLLSQLELAADNNPVAKDLLQQASLAFEGALNGDPENFTYVSNMANALGTLGQIHLADGDLAAAETSYQRAEDMVLSVLATMPDETPLHNNLGLAMKGLADVRMLAGNFDDAERRYRGAIRAFDVALVRLPAALIHNNRGSALHHLAKLYVSQGRRRSASVAYRSALVSANRALRIAPQHLLALSNKGLYCEELGELLLRRNRTNAPNEARRLFSLGTKAYGEAARLAPENAHYPVAAKRLYQYRHSLT